MVADCYVRVGCCPQIRFRSSERLASAGDLTSHDRVSGTHTDHTRLRKLVSRAFTPTAAMSYEPMERKVIASFTAAQSSSGVSPAVCCCYEAGVLLVTCSRRGGSRRCR